MDPFSILIFIILFALSGAFSGTETALTAVSDATLARLADAGSTRAALLKRMLEKRGRVIAALLVGNNIVNTVLAVYATVVFSAMFAGGTLLPPWAGPIVASIMAVVFLLVFGEVLPKSIAVSIRERWALASAWPVAGLMFVTRPVTFLLDGLSNAALRVMGEDPGKQNIFDVHEIHAMASLSAQAGVIDPMEQKLIQRASQLNDTRVREIMCPRTDIQALDVKAPLEAIRAFFQKTAFTRIPMYAGDLDDIVGILNFKEFFRHDPGRGKGFDPANYLHKPLFVTGSMFIGDLLTKMRESRTHMAIVLDEYGGTAGLITLEDVVEMLVGRIDDEYDVVETPFERVAEDTWEVDGRVTDERLLAQLGITLPKEVVDSFDTAAGLALRAFGNIPSEGDTVTYHGLEITASRVRSHRVRRVRIRVLSEHEAEQAAEAEQSARRKGQRQTGLVRGTEKLPDRDEPEAQDDMQDDTSEQPMRAE